MTDDDLMDIARPFAADGGRWPSDWIAAMRAVEAAEREACAKVCDVGNDPVLPEKYAEACRVAAALIRQRSNV